MGLGWKAGWAFLALMGTFGQGEALAPGEAEAWVQHLIPLPHRIEILAKRTLRPEQVKIQAPPWRELLLWQAVRELHEALQQEGEGASRGDFTLTLQIGGPEAKPLQTLKNADQAYTIFPEAEGSGLRLVALTPRGLLYAVKTLCQLLRARATKGRVEMPLLRITDWPDMAERGLWGSDAFHHLDWLGDIKMNVVEQIAAVWVDAEGKGHAGWRPGWEPMMEAFRYGIQPIPAVLHLNQLGGKGVFEAYPELRAQGGDEGAICFSQPAIVHVLADWLVDLGNLPHVSEVNVWLSENLHGKGGCRCERCRPHDRNVLETRAVLEAWRRARERRPGLGLRILLSEETYPSNEAILRELPEGVKVGYYHSLLTYNAYHDPMIDPLMERWARGGRWLGVYPQLNGAVGPAVPFTGPQFIHARMSEFVDKGLAGLFGYATPLLAYVRFNVEAAAEWAWNARGRSPQEFALSYAVRHRLPQPEKFAEWAEAIGQVAWDLYGSEWPTGELRRALPPVVKALGEGRLPPLGARQLGIYKKPWGEFASPQQLADDWAAARRATALARQMGIPQCLQESLFVEGCIQSLNALWELKQVLGPQGIAPAHREQAARFFRLYVAGCHQAAKALLQWCRLFDPQAQPTEEGRFWGVHNALLRTAGEMAELARNLGIPVEEETLSP